MEENKQIQTTETALDVGAATGKLSAMMAFIKDNLEKGNDYMSIGGGKPTLLKSGAEKMNILMGLSAQYHKTKEIINPNDKFYYVEVKCTLTHMKSQMQVAECLASCNNQEKARKHMEFADALNVVLKIAEKRAYVGATLNANALSQFYTQDLEDTETEPAITPKPNEIRHSCVDCGKEVSQKVRDWSVQRYEKSLCMDCQKKQSQS